MTAALARSPVAPGRLPSCPSHLTEPAAKEWRRIARALHRMGVVTEFDRAALAGSSTVCAETPCPIGHANNANTIAKAFIVELLLCGFV